MTIKGTQRIENQLLSYRKRGTGVSGERPGSSRGGTLKFFLCGFWSFSVIWWLSVCCVVCGRKFAPMLTKK